MFCIYQFLAPFATAVVVSRAILWILFPNTIVHTQELSPKTSAGCVLLQGCVPLEAG